MPDRLMAATATAEAVLLSFDGPLCHLFTAKRRAEVVAELRRLIPGEFSEALRYQADAVELYCAITTLAPELGNAVESALAAAEVEAAATAETTTGAFDVVRACRLTGRSIAIVSNNSAAAVETFLSRRDRGRYFKVVIGRAERPELMKPSPVPIFQALEALNIRAEAAVLVGDSVADIEAARRAGVPCIGYADKPGKAKPLTAAGADAVVTDLSDLAAAIASTRRPQSRLAWIESAGGPLVVVPETALVRWQGVPAEFEPDDLSTWGDYGRACEVDDYAGRVDVGDEEALVLGGEPASTTYLPDQRLFVRWIHADSEDDVIRLTSKAVEAADWQEVGTWTTSGPSRLFDSAYAGGEPEEGNNLVVDVPAGTYSIRTAHVKPEDGLALVLVQLA